MEAAVIFFRKRKTIFSESTKPEEVIASTAKCEFSQKKPLQ